MKHILGCVGGRTHPFSITSYGAFWLTYDFTLATNRPILVCLLQLIEVSDLQRETTENRSGFPLHLQAHASAWTSDVEPLLKRRFWLQELP
jgi:hypothetical protein